MASVTLQFLGTDNWRWLIVLSCLVAVSLVLWAGVQLARRRVRYGLICLASAAGPAGLAPALLIDAARSAWIGRRRQAGRSLLAAAAVAVPTVLTIVLAARAGAGLATTLAVAGFTAGVAGAVGVFYASVYGQLGTGRLAGLMALRVAAIAALVLILFKPALSLLSDDDAGKPYLLILVDRSASMSIADEENMPPRYDQAVQMLQTQVDRIERTFRPVWYRFATSTDPQDGIDDLAGAPAGGDRSDATDLAEAIRTATGDFAPSRVAGVVLVTDGRDNAGLLRDVTLAAARGAVPIHAVGVGSPTESPSGRRNLRLVGLDGPVEAIVDNQATLRARAQISGYAGRFFKLTLIEPDSRREIATASVTTSSPSDVVPVELHWTPRRPDDANSAGSIRRLVASLQQEDTEAVKLDNASELHVRLTQPRIRVLYIEGSMRPEYRAVKRLLDSDRNVQFMGLIRMSANTFWAQGSIEGRQLTALPSSDEDFRLLDVLILGDVDKTFLAAGDENRLERIAKFVRDGGGLLMLGGRNSFGPGGYGGTPIEDVLPVRVGTRSENQELSPLLPQLTAAGDRHPILDGIEGFFPGPGGRKPSPDLPDLPALKGCVAVPGVKRGAEALMIHPSRRNESGSLAVLAVSPVVGKGRTAAFTADTTYQWDRPMRAMGLKTPYEPFWGQMVRWLAGVDTKSRKASAAAMVRVDRTYLRVGQEAQVTAFAWDPDAAQGDRPRITCKAVGGKAQETTPVTLATNPSASQQATGSFAPDQPGEYRLVVEATSADGRRELGRDEIALTVAPQSAEMDQLARNDDLLRGVAEASGGSFGILAGLPDLVDRITREQLQRSPLPAEGRTVRLFHFPLLFGLFVVLLTAEWLLRRGWQLQ